jgi:hypothetical protein
VREAEYLAAAHPASLVIGQPEVLAPLTVTNEQCWVLRLLGEQ